MNPSNRLSPKRDHIAMTRRRKNERRREKDQVLREREELIMLLGGRCAVATCTVDGNFAFDHVDGITWNIRSVNQRTRIRRIRAEWEDGIPVRLLCRKHNGMHNPKQGKPLVADFLPPVPPPPKKPAEVPF